MTHVDRMKYLRVALLLVGLTFVCGVYPLTIIWPSGWAWHTGQSEYVQMILGIYATLGVFLLLAARTPLEHRSLIRFTVWSSIVHWGIGSIGLIPPAPRTSLGRRPGVVRRRKAPRLSRAAHGRGGSPRRALPDTAPLEEFA